MKLISCESVGSLLRSGSTKWVWQRSRPCRTRSQSSWNDSLSMLSHSKYRACWHPSLHRAHEWQMLFVDRLSLAYCSLRKSTCREVSRSRFSERASRWLYCLTELYLWWLLETRTSAAVQTGWTVDRQPKELLPEPLYFSSTEHSRHWISSKNFDP